MATAHLAGIILEHLGFYYNRYYSKPLTPKSYGVENEQELIALAKDCVFVSKDKVLWGMDDDGWRKSELSGFRIIWILGVIKHG